MSATPLVDAPQQETKHIHTHTDTRAPAICRASLMLRSLWQAHSRVKPASPNAGSLLGDPSPILSSNHSFWNCADHNGCVTFSCFKETVLGSLKPEPKGTPTNLGVPVFSDNPVCLETLESNLKKPDLAEFDAAVGRRCPFDISSKSPNKSSAVCQARARNITVLGLFL